MSFLIRVVKLLVVPMVLFVLASCTKSNTLSLNGRWDFRSVDNTDSCWIVATVPGTVHTDLFAAGRISDPYIGCNSKRLGWIDSLDWEYRKTFTLPRSFSLDEPILLIFEGLDTFADVYLNDSLLFSACNMFREWRIDCSRFLRYGQNVVRVVLGSAVKVVAQKSKELGYRLPDGEWAHIRKAPYHFGWDWGPRIVTSGIWKSVSLLQNKGILIDNVSIATLSADSLRATMGLNLDYNIATNSSPPYRLRVCDVDCNMTLFDSTFVPCSVNGSISALFNISKPKLWWPNGHGYQHLYNLRVEFSDAKNCKLSRMCKVGVRTVKLISSPDSIGESFYFEVNGKPVFAKGANIIPPHTFIPEYTDSAWVALAQIAKNSRFNMVRIWGGGVYPPDVFFEACTERGILVWQDFMFACSLYPYDNKFSSNIQVEANQQVKRLRKHTSLALWCGNNEVSEGWYNWGWQKQLTPDAADTIWRGCVQLFDVDLRSIVNSLDSTRSYWSSSPKYGWGRNQSMTHGDSHYWGVWWGLEPFSKYGEKVPRFMSEYGMQGAPSLQTLKLFSGNNQLPDSVEMMCHQRHAVGYETINAYMNFEGFNPKNQADWVYCSQVTQAIAYKTAIEAQRLSSPRCMGTLYWQLNDSWPAVSWSGVDYLGYWKAAQFTIADSYRTIFAGAKICADTICVLAVSDSLNPISGLASIKVLNPSGEVLFSAERRVNLLPNLAQTIASVSVDEFGIDTSVCTVCIDIQTNSGKLFNYISFLGKVKNSQVHNPEIQARVEDDHVVLTTKYPAYFVQLSTDANRCKFNHNYLHLLPDREYSVYFTGNINGKVIIKSVNSCD